MPNLFVNVRQHMKLISADVCRDGGSIAADFRLSDKSILSLLLEVSRNGYPNYAHLHAGSEIQNTCDERTIVPKRSQREHEIISMLNTWKDSASQEPDEKANSVRWALELCNNIGKRSG